MRQLRTSVLDPRAKFILAHDLGNDPKRRPLEDPVLSQDDALIGDRLPVAFVDPLFQDDRRLGVAQAAGFDDDGQHHRVAHKHHRADLDLGQTDVARPFVGSGGDGKDGNVLSNGRLDGAKRIFARIGPAIGRQDHAGDRLAAMRRQHSMKGVTQRETPRGSA